MLQISHWIILFFIGVSHVEFGSGQYDTDFPQAYNLPKMLATISSIIRSSRNLKNLRNDRDRFSILDRYRDAISDETIDKFLQHSKPKSDEDRCFEDIRYAFNDTEAHDQLGLKMFDAFGKPESGILEGNAKWVGSYHECTHIYTPPNENATGGDFKGQYCMLDMTVLVFNKTMPISVGVCLPDSCGDVPLEKFNVAEFQLGPDVNITKKTCQPTTKKVTTAAIAMICVLSIFAIPALVGSFLTACEYFTKRSSEDTLALVRYNEQINEEDTERQMRESSTSVAFSTNQSNNYGRCGAAKEFFNCFCIFTNGEKILDTGSSEGQLLCLHGIRFLSMTWVIVCHTYGLLLVNLGNLVETSTILDTWLFQIILNGYYSVDSFFLLSGFLVAHLYFQESAKKKGKVSWLYFYVHRYVRLTPVYMLVLGFHTALYYYIGSGPLWTTNEIEPTCQEYWWYNILYINNFLPAEKECMGWSWYLATDMQFFVICPILLITLRRWPTIGYSVLGLFMSATVAANFAITYYYDLRSGYGGEAGSTIMDFDFNALMAQEKSFNEKIYVKPYTRMSPYLIGIALAYFLFKRKQKNAGKLNLLTLVCGWIVAAAISLSCLFCLYHRQLSVTESAFYNALSHASFTAGLSWVIFTCLNKQAELVNSILSFKLLIPLSRLTYCAYLIHPIIVHGYFEALKTMFQFSEITMVTSILGLLMIIYASAFVVSVLFEAPLIRLEKLVRTKLLR